MQQQPRVRVTVAFSLHRLPSLSLFSQDCAVRFYNHNNNTQAFILLLKQSISQMQRATNSDGTSREREQEGTCRMVEPNVSNDVTVPCGFLFVFFFFFFVFFL
jgi:hypothetical protein